MCWQASDLLLKSNGLEKHHNLGKTGKHHGIRQIDY